MGTEVREGLRLHEPASWRVLNYLHTKHRVVDHPGSVIPSGKASMHDIRPARQSMTRQNADPDNMIHLERMDLITASIAGTWAKFSLEGNPSALREQPRGFGTRGVYIQLTSAGRAVVRNPMNLIIRGIGHRRRVMVGDMAQQIGVTGENAKRLLLDMEEADMIRAYNDRGTVELKMWKQSPIPTSLRLALLPAGAQYLHRK